MCIVVNCMTQIIIWQRALDVINRLSDRRANRVILGSVDSVFLTGTNCHNAKLVAHLARGLHALL